MKKTVSLLLALIMCVTLLPTLVFAASGGEVGADELEISEQVVDYGTVPHGTSAKKLKRDSRYYYYAEQTSTAFPITVKMNIEGEVSAEEAAAYGPVRDDEIEISARSVDLGTVVMGAETVNTDTQ